MSSSVLSEHANAIATLTLNRPHKLNTINYDMADTSLRLLDDIEEHPSLGAGIVTGSGKRALELLLTGDTFSAERARTMGLVNQVVAHERLMAGRSLERAQRVHGRKSAGHNRIRNSAPTTRRATEYAHT